MFQYTERFFKVPRSISLFRMAFQSICLYLVYLFSGHPQYPQHLISRLFISNRRLDLPHFGHTYQADSGSSRELPQYLQLVDLKSNRGRYFLQCGHLWYRSITYVNQKNARTPIINKGLFSVPALRLPTMRTNAKAPDTNACFL